MQATLSTPQQLFSRLATNVLAVDRFTYPGGQFSGTNSWAPGGYGFFIPRDTAMAIRYAPDLFSAADIQNICNQTASLQGLSNASVGTFIQSNDGSVHAGTPFQIDHSMEFVDIIYSHYKKTGSATAFAQYQGQISNTLTYPFITNHLVFVKTNNPAQVGFGFEDNERMCGYNLMCSVEWYRTMQQMGEMLASLGRNSDATYYSNEMVAIRTNLQTYLWDSTTNLFFAGTISNSIQHSVPGTAYAIVTGAAPPAVAALATAKLQQMLPWNSDGLAGRGAFWRGESRNMIEGEFWSTFSPGPVVRGDYQNGGYWGLYTLWVARAVQTISQSDSDALMQSLAWSYYNTPASVAPYEYEFDPTKIQGNRRGAGTFYLANSLGALGYYKTTDTNR